MGYQVLESVICKYNYPPHRNAGLNGLLPSRGLQEWAQCPTFHSQDQTFLKYCSFSDSNHQ